MVEYLHNLHNEVDIRIKSFGHAGDGNLHSYILKDDLSQEEFEKRMAAAMEKIYEKAAQLGGKVSGEHGIGFAKKPYLRESLDPETIELMSGIKKAFDPKNILNPHKVFQKLKLTPLVINSLSFKNAQSRQEIKYLSLCVYKFIQFSSKWLT